MTIQFLAQWNGYEEDSIQSLSVAEEGRLVAAGLARYYSSGIDGGSGPISIAARRDAITGQALLDDASLSVINSTGTQYRAKLLSDLASRFYRSRNFNARTRLAIFDDSQSVAATFTGALSAATSATLTASINNGAWWFRFSNGETRLCTVSGGTAVSWTGAVTATASAKWYTQVNSDTPPTIYVGSGFIAQANNQSVNLTTTYAAGVYGLSGFKRTGTAIAVDGTVSTTSTVSGGKIRFAFSGRFIQTQFGNTAILYSPKIDGQYVVSSGIDVNTGTTPYVQMDFGASAGKGRVRQYELETSRNQSIGAIWIDADAYLGPPAYSPKVVIAGDSMTAFQYSDSGSPSADYWDNNTWSRQFSDLIGVPDCCFSGLPGTGFVAAGSYSTFGARMAVDVIAQNPDVVFLAYSGSNDSTDITSTVVQNIKTLRAALPLVPVVVLDGILSASVGSNSTKAGYIVSAVAQVNDPMVQLIRLVTATNPFFTGSGKQGAGATNTTSDWMLGTDGVHPTQAGGDAIARFIADNWMPAVSKALSIS